jgi:hypothetical protein
MLEQPSIDAIVRSTQLWLERAVIGLGLCPFARAVHVKGQIRYVVSKAEGPDALLAELRRELRALSDADPLVIETTLLIAPHALADFLDYNDCVRRAEQSLKELGLTGTLQIASFHPNYQFGDVDSSDVANCTNRSPYPILHLLREASVTRAVESFAGAAQIFEKNIATLRALGHDGWERVLAGQEARR